MPRLASRSRSSGCSGSVSAAYAASRAGIVSRVDEPLTQLGIAPESLAACPSRLCSPSRRVSGRSDGEDGADGRARFFAVRRCAAALVRPLARSVLMRLQHAVVGEVGERRRRGRQQRQAPATADGDREVADVGRIGRLREPSEPVQVGERRARDRGGRCRATTRRRKAPPGVLARFRSCAIALRISVAWFSVRVMSPRGKS